MSEKISLDSSEIKTVLSGKSIEPWYGFYCYRFGFWR